MFFSKHSSVLIFGLTILVGLAGCAGENQAYFSTPEIKFETGKFTCLKNVDEHFKQFLDGVLADQTVGDFWDCLDSAVIQFVKYVRGHDGAVYTPKEIANFLDLLFLDKRGLAQEEQFLEELMWVKRVFVGGSLANVTHLDLVVRTRDLLKEFKTLSLEVNPHMIVLHQALSAQNAKSLNPSDERVQLAVAAVQKAGRKLGTLIQGGRQFYSFSHLEALILEIEKFLRKTDPNFNFDKFKKYVPLMRELKNILVAPPDDLIRVEDWTRLGATLGNLIGWVVNFRFHVEGPNWDQGPGIEWLAKIIHEAIGELKLGLAEQPNKLFEFNDLDRVVSAIGEISALPLELKVETVQDAVRRVGNSLLDKSGSQKGLDLADLNKLSSEVERWLEIQRAIGANWTADALKPSDKLPSELNILLSSRWPLNVDDRGRLIFSPSVYKGSYTRKSLTTLNWQRAIIRMLMRAYARQSSEDGARELTLEQFIEFAKEWQTLAVNLKLFEPGEAEKMAKKIFTEANLFLLNSDGDDKLSFVEALQYLAFGVSGLNASSHAFESFGDACAASEAPSRMRMDCFRSMMFDSRASHLGHVPGLLKFLGQDRKVWTVYENFLEITTRDHVSEAPLSRGDLVEMMVLIQYIETFFGTYDHDLSDTISVDETIESFPTYQLSLNEIVKSSYGFELNPDELLALYTYLFKYGEPPKSSGGGLVKFYNWRIRRDRWKYNADRQRVLGILAELNSRR